MPKWLALANVLSASDTSRHDDDLALPFDAASYENFAKFSLAMGVSPASRPSAASASDAPASSTKVANRGAWSDGFAEGPASDEGSSRAPDLTGSEGLAEANTGGGSAGDLPLTIADGATVAIDGPSAQSVTFAGSTGTLKLDDPQGYTGVISGLSGADAIDLSGFAYGANVTATYSGNASGGTLTVTDGAKTAQIALVRRLPVVGLDAVQRWQGRHDRGRSDLAESRGWRRRLRQRHRTSPRRHDGRAH